MEIVEQSQARLTMVARPWGQSLASLGIAVFMSLVTLEGIAADEEAWAQTAAFVFALAVWGSVFGNAQRTEVTFDRNAGLVRIARYRMIGRAGLILPLSTVIGARAWRAAPLKRWPWQYQITLECSVDGFDARTYLASNFFTGEQTIPAAESITAWLDSTRAAA
jgi:hypothetical protein